MDSWVPGSAERSGIVLVTTGAWLAGPGLAGPGGTDDSTVTPRLCRASPPFGSRAVTVTKADPASRPLTVTRLPDTTTSAILASEIEGA